MEYIYDILLNFQEEYCDFFEWKLDDKVLNIKKIPLYKISNKDYLSLKYHEVILQDNTFPKKNKMMLVTNGIEVMGLLLNKTNKVIKRSSLLLEEAEDVLGYLPELKNTSINYTKHISHPINYQGRLYKEKNNYINKFLSNINISKDEYLLKYLYFEIYNEEESNLEKIYQKLCDLKKNNINKLYISIKLLTNY